MNSTVKKVLPAPSGRSGGGDRGAVVVEAAFVTSLLIMLLVGTVTAAVAYSQNTSLQTAAREASRYGAALPVDADIAGWLGKVLDVAKAAGNNDLGSTVPGQAICVAYVYPSGSSSNDRTTRIKEVAGVRTAPAAAPKDWCFDDGRPDSERRVQVSVRRDATIQAALFSVDVHLSVPSVARFERTS